MIIPSINNKDTNASMKKILAIAICALGIGVTDASALITFDLRANGGTLSGGTGKTITAASNSGTVVLEIWAQITNAAGDNTKMGVQSILGSIVSVSTPGTATGSVALATFPSIFNVTSQAGAQAALSTIADGITDLGSTSTTSTSTPQYIKPRKDPTAGGAGYTIPTTGTVAYATKDTAGVTANLITNGVEILMGTATLSLSSFNSGTLTMNWVKPAVTSPANKGQIAAWTDGDALTQKTGSTNEVELVYAAGVVINAIPEPSAFGMVMLGALGLVGFRRLGLRRTA